MQLAKSLHTRLDVTRQDTCPAEMCRSDAAGYARCVRVPVQL